MRTSVITRNVFIKHIINWVKIMINIFNIRPKGLNVGNDAIFVAMRHYIYKAFGNMVTSLKCLQQRDTNQEQ